MVVVMGTEPVSGIFVTLDRDGVAAPAQRVVMIASQVVGTCLRALANEDLSPPELQGGFISYRFSGPEMSVGERRETYQNWILSKGFQDLARGVRATLEEALFYIDMGKLELRRATLKSLQVEMVKIRKKGAGLHFPKLLKEVNKDLSEPMSFAAEFKSLQKVRNCLEHRGGLVGHQDVDRATRTMTLSFPRLGAFYRRGDEEVELALGGVDEEISVYLKLVTRSQEYALGAAVVISADDFAEIATACHLFATEIASKLPGETS
jgi:hypothetical protein